MLIRRMNDMRRASKLEIAQLKATLASLQGIYNGMRDEGCGALDGVVDESVYASFIVVDSIATMYALPRQRSDFRRQCETKARSIDIEGTGNAAEGGQW